MRRAARQDANHRQIRSLVRGIVAHRRGVVEDTSRFGDGWPDLLVVAGGRAVAIEVKDGTKPPSARKLTEDEEAFRSRWCAAGGRYEVVETDAQAEALAKELIR